MVVKYKDMMSRATKRRTSSSLKQKEKETPVGNAPLRHDGRQGSWLWAPFVVWNMVICLVAVGVLIGAELNPQWRIPLGLLGAAGVLLAVPITHFVGGYWRHGGHGWHVWQPFRGGRVFVALQAVAWILFTLTLLSWSLPVLYGSLFRVHPDTHPLLLPHGLLLFIGACGFLSEALMAVSLLHFAAEPMLKKRAARSSSSRQVAASGVPQALGPPSPLRSVWSRDDLARMGSVENLAGLAPVAEPSSDSEEGGGGEGEAEACGPPPIPLPRSSRALRVLVVVNLLVTTVSCALAAACDLWAHWGAGEEEDVPSYGGGAFVGSLKEGVSSAVSVAARGNAMVAACAVGCGVSLCVVTSLTHGLGGWWSWGHREWKFWQPFDGGFLFVVIQAIAWSLFGVTLLSFGLAAYGAVFVAWRVRGLVASASFSGLVSEVLLVLSLLFFRGRLRAPLDTSGPAGTVDTTTSQTGSPTVNRESQLPYAVAAAALSISSTASRRVKAPSGSQEEAMLAGKMQPVVDAVGEPPPPVQSKASRRTKEEGKVGGGLKMGGTVLLKEGGGAEFAEWCTTPEAWSPRMVQAAVGGPFSVGEWRYREVLRWACSRAKSFGTLFLLYAPHHIFWTLLVSPLVLLPLRTAGGVYLFAAAVYLPWYIGSPHKDGSRHWPAARAHFTQILEEAYLHHFGGLQLIRESTEPLPATAKYVFGYHPHGLYPATMAWFTSSSAWRRLMPTVNPVVLVATVIFRVPVLREIMLWQGGREVSRLVFARSLESHGSVMLCPGGQSELVHHCCGDRKKVILCARKTGFVRLALQGGANLVPVFCFGENRCLENIFDWPTVQRITYKRLGFPIPFLPAGMWGWTPIPLKRPLAIVIGKPIVPPRSSTPGAPTPEEVEAVRACYFEEVRSLFERHKAQYGCADIDIVLRD